MTTLRDAAQQALEALEDHATQYPHMQKGYTVDAIAALRAALEQQAERAQEPAGWFEGPFGAFRANQLYKIAWPASTVAWSIPLYTAPPQRKPLTDDEILEMVRAAPDLGSAEDEWLHVARAIERAHGIGEGE